MTIVDLIRLNLSVSGLTARQYETLMLYDMDMLRMVVEADADMTNQQVVEQFAAGLAVGICGETANQLAEILLGRDLGRALQDAATAELGGDGDAYDTGTLGGQRSCAGRGIKALEQALSSHFGFGDAVCMINLGNSHRFLAVKQKTTIEVLQVWYDPNANVGYGLTDWLAANNARISHTVGEFITTLGNALTGDRDQARELFQPVAGPTLPPDHFDLQGKTLSFAAVAMDANAVASRYTVYHQQRVALLN